MSDTIQKSAVQGRLLSSIICLILSGYLASKGYDMTADDKEAVELWVTSGMALLASIATIYSKFKNRK